jgi:hypothetical protein
MHVGPSGVHGPDIQRGRQHCEAVKVPASLQCFLSNQIGHGLL